MTTPAADAERIRVLRAKADEIEATCVTPPRCPKATDVALLFNLLADYIEATVQVCDEEYGCGRRVPELYTVYITDWPSRRRDDDGVVTLQVCHACAGANKAFSWNREDQ